MDELQDRLSAILGNPQMMGQIMSMAQALGQSAPAPSGSPPQKQENHPPQQKTPSLELSALQALMQKPSGPDPSQQALLRALKPYLSSDKLHRLERAIQAARLAQLASSMLAANGQSNQGKQVNHV